jgi:hypothetical protein
MTQQALSTKRDDLSGLFDLVIQVEPTAERKTVKGHDGLEYIVIPTQSENRSIILSSSQGHIRGEEFIRGWYDRSGWGEPTVTTIFVMVDGTLPHATFFNLSFALREDCLRLLHGLDKAWNGAIAEVIRTEARDILTQWA